MEVSVFEVAPTGSGTNNLWSGDAYSTGDGMNKKLAFLTTMPVPMDGTAPRWAGMGDATTCQVDFAAMNSNNTAVNSIGVYAKHVYIFLAPKLDVSGFALRLFDADGNPIPILNPLAFNGVKTLSGWTLSAGSGSRGSPTLSFSRTPDWSGGLPYVVLSSIGVITPPSLYVVVEKDGLNVIQGIAVNSSGSMRPRTLPLQQLSIKPEAQPTSGLAVSPASALAPVPAERGLTKIQTIGIVTGCIVVFVVIVVVVVVVLNKSGSKPDTPSTSLPPPPTIKRLPASVPVRRVPKPAAPSLLKKP